MANEIMQMSNHSNKIQFTYAMDRTPLMITEHIYLGVQLHHRLSWQPHSQELQICKMASIT